MIKFIFSL
nr:unnamed protein product [Callosobruchus chinensis]